MTARSGRRAGRTVLALATLWLPGAGAAARLSVAGTADAAAPLGASVDAPAPVVRLLVPTQPGLLELTVLTRAELSAAGFVVEERAIPNRDPDVWLDEARRDRVLAVVILGSGKQGAPRARLWLFGGKAGQAGPESQPHDLRTPVGSRAARASEGLVMRARTTLAVRIAEHLREHRAFTLAQRPAHDRASAAPVTVAARPSEGAPPAVQAAPVRASAGHPAAPINPAAAAALAHDPGQAASHRFELGLLGGLSLHPGSPSVGVELALSRRFGLGLVARIGLMGRLPTGALSTSAGTVRLYESAGWAALGIEAPRLWGVVPEASLDLGVHHTLLVGQGSTGFDRHTEPAWSALLAGTLGLARPLTGRTTVYLGARIFALVPGPLVFIDDLTVSRTGPGYEARLGLRLRL